jgi:succinate dehydrogenase/fumarate reductase cytochrome b subunit
VSISEPHPRTPPKSGGCGPKCGCSHHLDAVPHAAVAAAPPACAPIAAPSPVSSAQAETSQDDAQQACGCGNHAAATSTQTAVLAHGGIVTVGPVVQTPPSASPAPHKCACKTLRPYRRMHSLAGLIFAAFLAVHLGVAATAVSPARFQANATFLHVLTERFPALELIGVGIPLLVLLVFGVHLLVEAGLSPARKRCNRGGRTRYFLQRISTAVS